MSLKTSLEHISGLDHRLTITTPTDAIQARVDARLIELAKKLKIDGFRPGKAPLQIVKKLYEGNLIAEALQDLMTDSLQKAVEQEKIHMAGYPKVDVKEAYQPGKDLTFSAIFETMPEVTHVNLDNQEVEIIASEITEKDIDDDILKLREQRPTWTDVDRAAKQGDRITINFVVKVDGKPVERFSMNDVVIVIGSKTMIPDFEDGLLGLAKEGKKEIHLKCPAQYPKPLSGKEATFEVHVTKIEQPILPELNDEFLKFFGGEIKTVEDLRHDSLKKLQRVLTRVIQNRNKTQVFDKLLALHPLELPKGMLEQEVGRLKEQMQSAQKQSLDIPNDLFLDQARKNLALHFLIQSYIAEKNITADPAKVEALINEMALSHEKPEELRQHCQNDPEAKRGLENAVIENTVVDLLLAGTKKKVKNISYNEVVTGQGV